MVIPSWFSALIESPHFQNIMSSLIFLGAVLLVRHFVMRAVKDWESEARLAWIVHSRNAAFFIAIIGIVIIWASELRAVAFSVVALAVAIVIATKELILCILGGIFRSSDRPFGIGDRIEIQHHRGDVIDQSLFTTTILEIGPGPNSHQYTGRAVVLPNSIFLQGPIINETYTDEYVLHIFTFPMNLDDDWRQAEETLLRAANEECNPFLESAKKHLERQSRSRGLDAPTSDPRVYLHFPEPGRVNLLVRVPTQARHKGRIEQAILRRFLESFRGSLRAVQSTH